MTEKMAPVWKGVYTNTEELKKQPAGTAVTVRGMVYAVRDMGSFVFLILRCGDGLVQCVYDKTGNEAEKGFLREEAALEVTGKLGAEPRAAGGVEIRAGEVRLLCAPPQGAPLQRQQAQGQCGSGA